MEVIAAHQELDGGMTGGSSRWYLARLDPARAARTEADLLARLRDLPGTGNGARMTALPDHLGAAKSLAPHLPDVIGVDKSFQIERLSPGARAWRLAGGWPSCILFFDDRFLLYLESQ